MSGWIIEIDATWDGAPCAPGEAVQLLVEVDGDDLVLTIDAPFHDDPAPPGPPGSVDGLWDYEVVELFVVAEGSAPVRYLEIELGPHGHHLGLQLEGLRRVVERGLPIRYAARVAGERWSGEARIPRAWLPPAPHRVNAYAIHGTGASRRYLALATVPGDRPDFHQPDHFVALTFEG